MIALIGLMYSCGNKKEQDEVGKIAEVAKEQSQAPAPEVIAAKKYTIKSGVIEYSYKIETMEHKEVVSFDDYGMKECKDTYEDGGLKTSQFSDGVKMYKVIYKDKTAYILGDAGRGTEFKCDWNEVGEKQKSSGEATKLANITILGKDCEQFTVKTGKISTTFAGWGGILLFMEQKTPYGNSTQKALKFEENAAVSPDKFKVPAGFEVKAS
jgi:hypothetical protein